MASDKLNDNFKVFCPKCGSSNVKKTDVTIKKLFDDDKSDENFITRDVIENTIACIIEKPLTFDEFALYYKCQYCKKEFACLVKVNDLTFTYRYFNIEGYE